MPTAPWERSVTYGAVGATQAVDLMTYPPAGFRPVERRVRVGFGEARWTYAWTSTLSWGIQRVSGFEVDRAESPPDVTDLTYSPVGFDSDGIPVEPATTGPADQPLTGPDGSPFLAPGDTANLRFSIGPVALSAPVRVVYVINERTRKGFAYGTLPGHPFCGEESWVVDRTDDGSVWLTIRAFSRPSQWYWRVIPVIRMMQRVYTGRYERALAGPIIETGAITS